MEKTSSVGSPANNVQPKRRVWGFNTPLPIKEIIGTLFFWATSALLLWVCWGALVKLVPLDMPTVLYSTRWVDWWALVAGLETAARVLRRIGAVLIGRTK